MLINAFLSLHKYAHKYAQVTPIKCGHNNKRSSFLWPKLSVKGQHLQVLSTFQNHVSQHCHVVNTTRRTQRKKYIITLFVFLTMIHVNTITETAIFVTFTPI